MKHGIDFVEAQALWLDQDFVEVPGQSENEERWMMMGMIAGRHWTAVVSDPGSSRVRLISARRARPREVAIYESRGL